VADQLLFRDQNTIEYVDPITCIKTGKPGHPCKQVNASFLCEAISSKRRISQTEIAKILGIHRHVLRHNLLCHGVYYKWTQLSNRDLNILVKTYQSTKPDSGIQYLIGYLCSHGIWIQKRRVTASIAWVDGLGQVLCQCRTIRHPKYCVSRTNYLWHVDGHHKLILWGIVLHGFADGCDQTVCVNNISFMFVCIDWWFRWQTYMQAQTTEPQLSLMYSWRLFKDMAFLRFVEIGDGKTKHCHCIWSSKRDWTVHHSFGDRMSLPLLLLKLHKYLFSTSQLYSQHLNWENVGGGRVTICMPLASIFLLARAPSSSWVW